MVLRICSSGVNVLVPFMLIAGMVGMDYERYAGNGSMMISVSVVVIVSRQWLKYADKDGYYSPERCIPGRPLL